MAVLVRGRATIEQLILQFGVLIVAFMVFAGELGVPFGIPIEVALLLVGAYTLHSGEALVGAVVLVVVADVLGTTLLYYLVRAGSRRVFARVLRKLGQDATLMDRWETRMRRYGARTVFAGRMLPMVRMYITIAAGLTRMPFGRFLLGEAPAAAIWSGAPLIFGYFFRHDVRALIGEYTSFSHAATLILPAVGPVVALIWWIQHGKTPKERLHRLRAVLSITSTFVIIAYLVEAIDHFVSGHSGLVPPLTFLLPFLVVLAGISLTLLLIGIADLRSATRRITLPHPLIRLIAPEFRTTVVWFTLMVVAGIIIAGIELHYPTITLLYR
ncbi:MAG TPA: VTT domain-containing protein [Thermomicrobiaceae bacterium]|nr:VTT domain-containing protein [Thermomicrobiaceae bacterium]